MRTPKLRSFMKELSWENGAHRRSSSDGHRDVKDDDPSRKNRRKRHDRRRITQYAAHVQVNLIDCRHKQSDSLPSRSPRDVIPFIRNHWIWSTMSSATKLIAGEALPHLSQYRIRLPVQL